MFIPIVFCSGVALFAATKAWHKLSAAGPAGTHKAAHLKGKQFAGYKPVNNFAKDAPISIDYGGHDFTLHTGKPAGILLTSSGVDAPSPGVYGSPVALGSGLTYSQNGVGLDAAGNMFVTDIDNGNEVVKKITADGSSTTIIGSGFITQSANTAVDKAGNVYVVDQGVVSKIPVGATPGTYDAPAVINNTFARPFAIAADTAGNIYVTDLGVGVFKMTNDGTGKIKIDNAIANGSGIALDAVGNVYVCDYVSLKLYEIPAAGGPEVQLASGFNFPRALAVDGMGNIFVCDGNNASIYEVPPGGGSPTAVISGLSSPVGLAVDASHNLYVADRNPGVGKYSPVGGYFISQPLPAGMNFDNTTGAITGKPTTVTAEKSYIISAYNSVGGVSDTLRLSVAASVPVPVVSYNSPVVDTLGVRISPITPSATGVDAPGFAPYVAVANGFLAPLGIASDAAGNIYVADKGNNIIKKVPADGSATISLGSGFNNPSGVAVDASGFIYVADADNGQVEKMSADGLTITNIGSGFSAPVGVALDGAGNVYVADAGAASVYKILASDGSTISLSNSFDALTGIAVDNTGQNIYVSDGGAQSVYKINPIGGHAEDLGFNFIFPVGVALDPQGNLYVSDADNAHTSGLVYKGDGKGCNFVSTGSTFAFPSGVAIDPSGNLFVADSALGVLYEVIPSGGYFLATTLPKGLKLNDTTGVITGRPTAPGLAADYKIIAYNAGGGTPALVNITVFTPPPPTLSYTNPNVDFIGVRITPITPTASNVAAPRYAPFKSFANGFSNPGGIATDAAGNIYVADKGNNQVMKVPADGSPAAAIGSGFSGPSGIAVDAAGNIYVADTDNGEVKKMSPDGLTISSIGSGFSAPVGVAVDGAGNVYVADRDNEAAYKILISDGSVVTLSNDFDTPSGIAVDLTGQNIYVSDAQANSVFKVSPTGCGCNDDLGYVFNSPTAVALDPQGNVFITDVDIYTGGPGLVYKVDDRGCNLVDVGSHFVTPDGIAVDPAGNLFVTDATPGTLYKVTPWGGYFLATVLPKGLKLNDTTGVITGRPAALSAAADYKVIAYNSGGGTPALVNIEVIIPPAPALSYTTPNTYVAGTAITPLQPTSTNVAAPDYQSSFATIGTGFNAPRGTAVDRSGNVFVADSLNNAVKMIPVGGGPAVPWGSGFSGPTGVAVDSLGFVYVADYGNQSIKKIAPDGVTVTNIASVDEPVGVAVDSARNVYAADMHTGFIYKIAASDGSVEPINTLFPFPYPTGIAAGAKDIYVSDGVIGGVARLTGGTAVPDLIGPFNYPAGVAVDAGGNLYVSDEADSVIYRVPVGGHTGTALSTTGFSGNEGLSVDGKGNLYVADVNNNLVGKISPDGGYYINKPLPVGLGFNAKTGTVSGTPAAGSAARSYTVTAYNAGGSATATFDLGITLPPPPALSYTGPNVYTIGTVIPSLTPSIVNNNALIYTADPTTVSTGFNFIGGITTDKTGNIYVADLADNSVTKLPPGGTGSSVVLSTDFDQPQNIAVDAAGNVYVADTGNGVIKKIPNGSGSPVSLGVSFEDPAGVAVDGAGNVYVADEGGGSNGAVYKLAGGKGPRITVTTDLTDPIGVAVDGAGNIFVMDAGTEAVYKLAGGTGSPVRIGPLLNTGGTITVDNGGNVYVSDLVGVVYIIPADGSATKTINNLGFPFGVAVDGSGNLYVSEPFENSLKEIPPAGGLYISPSLPAGLSFNSATGTISGTPTTPSPATDYTVTAYNLGGNASATVNVKVKSNVAALSTLSTSVRSLSPGFNTTVTAYSTAVLPYITASTKITASPTEPGATIQARVNGSSYIPVTNGSPSDDLPFSLGANTLDVQVTSEDASVTKTYSIAFTRQHSDLLSALSYSPSTPRTRVDSADFVNYTTSVNYAVGAMKVTPTAQDPTSTITVNGVTVASGSTSNPVALIEGVNTITTVVKTVDNITKTYKMVVIRNGDPRLIKLALSSSVALTKVHGTNYADYTATVPYAVSSVTLTPTASATTAVIKVNSAVVTSGSASAPITLNVGLNTIVTQVTSSDGTVYVYSIAITRQHSPLLTALNFSPSVSRTRADSADFVNYTASVDYSVSAMTVMPVAQDPTSTIKVNGVTVASGGTSNPVVLNVGANTILTVVTTIDNVTKTYKMVVMRSGDPRLSKIAVTPSVTLTRVTGADYADYTATVPYSVTSATLTPTATDLTSVITVNNVGVASGSASAPITLNTGANTIVTKVTAFGGASNTYRITLTRQHSPLLTALTFNPSTTRTRVDSADFVNFTTTVSNSVGHVTITPVAQDPTSTIKINGTIVASGITSGDIALNVGVNTILTVVTTPDNLTKTYKMVMTRLAPSPGVMAYDQPKEMPVMSEALVVHQNVSPNGDGNSDALKIDGITSYPDNKLQIMSRAGNLVYEVKGYDNTTKVFDGHNNDGRLQQAGTYFYSLEYKVGSETKRKTGYIVLKY